jgi:methane monooxygenase component A beta chain/propane monooxygenase small subunit
VATPPFEGHRTFTWFTPRRRAATEYELYTVGQQSDPGQWLHVGWPIRFDDGREPFMASSTAIGCGNWFGYRDPAGLWQRPYVASANHTEQALARLIPAELSVGLGGSIDAGWLDPVLSRYYAAWPFVEYGLFLALCYAVREALGDTIAFSIAFQAGDRMRHLQDIVHLMFDLAEAREGFTDAGARDAWMTDPVLMPARENIERIVSCRDWFEVVVAVNLVFEPIVGRLMKTELLARNAPRHGDAVTPLVLASANADTERHRAATAELVRLVLADPSHGDGNRVVLAGWLDKWTAESIRAAEALAPLFGAGASETIGSCLSRVLAGQLDLLTGLGLVGGVQASQADGRAQAGRVGISLMLSAETEAAVELVREQTPDAAVGFRGPFRQLKVRLSHRPIIMIAGGSGLAPIELMAADLADRRNTGPVTVFFGVRAAADLFHLERLEAIRGRMPGLEIVPVLSEPAPGWAGETGLVTDAVDRRLPRLSGYDAYLCGPPAMIDAAVELVNRRGCVRAMSASTRSCRRADRSARADTTASSGKRDLLST